MVSRLSIPLLVLVVLLPVTASAKKPPKPMLLEPFAAELREQKGELSKQEDKALRVASRCLKDDELWVQRMENDPVNRTYESLGGAVVCWQGAEKQALKSGDGFGAARQWIQTRTRYVETLRSFFFAMMEKLQPGADRKRVCDRLTTALKEVASAKSVGEALVEAFQSGSAKALAGQLDADVTHWGETLVQHFENQKCG
ncbi:MAG: hypothetical protein VX498_03165 [Myxococcota bacterium]|nr:hypothetical protein [Myxococcota bacterium]